MRYIKLFEKDLDLSDYEEDWEESPTDWDFDEVYEEIKDYVDKNGFMAIKIDIIYMNDATGEMEKSQDWNNFVDICQGNDIIWASKRPVEIDDRNLKKAKKSIVVTVYPFKTNKDRLKLKFHSTVSGFKGTHENAILYNFNNKKIELYSD